MSMLAPPMLTLAASLAFADNVSAGSLRTASSLPELAISRAGSEHEWPFSVEAGTLTCVAVKTQTAVIFSEPWRTDAPQEFGNMTLPRSVVVSTNPVALLASLEDRDLYAPFDSLETLIKRLAPFETMGQALCDADAPQTRELRG